MRGNLTVNYGLRYEYVSPFVEADNRLVNLDVPPDFTAAVPVEAGQSGPFTGSFPLSLVQPDRNNVAPRVGIAWKPQPKWTIRTGYGINYNLGAYGTIAQNSRGSRRLPSRPPRSAGSTPRCLIVDPFAGVAGSTTTNSYGIDRTFQLGVAQIWNVDVQRDLPRNLTLNVGYTGTHGSDLDIQRAPNRDPDGGVRIPGRAAVPVGVVRRAFDAAHRERAGPKAAGARPLVRRRLRLGARVRQRVDYRRRRCDRRAERSGSRRPSGDDRASSGATRSMPTI